MLLPSSGHAGKGDRCKRPGQADELEHKMATACSLCSWIPYDGMLQVVAAMGGLVHPCVTSSLKLQVNISFSLWVKAFVLEMARHWCINGCAGKFVIVADPPPYMI